jgi:xanthine dehydrogenase accessory factor
MGINILGKKLIGNETIFMGKTMGDIYDEIVAVRNQGQDAALVSVISASGSTPRKTDAKMLVKSDGSILGTIGGGNLELLVTKEALKTIQTGKPKRISYNLAAGGDASMICGGETEILIEPILTFPSLYICGGGHIGLALAKMGKLLNYRVTVIDDRPEYANPARFPEAEQCIVHEYADVFTGLQVDRSSLIAIVTHGHKGDEAALISALNTPALYIGMIGSKKKVASTFAHLREKGISPQQLSRVHAPIGIEIYGQTPEEIAVSIIAEIIAVRRAPVK